jgi:hypothetical protein
MKRLQIAFAILVVALLAVALGLLALLKVARDWPDSRPGRAMFEIGYSRTADKMQFLLNYQDRLASHNDNGIPAQVDRFLVGRLAVIAPESNEWVAIVKFYRRMPISAWTGLGGSSEPIKKALISELIASLDEELPVVQDFEPTLLQVESLRSGAPLNDAKLEGTETTESRRLAVRAFKLWWRNGTTWPENKVVNPLEGTGVAVVKPEEGTRH